MLYLGVLLCLANAVSLVSTNSAIITVTDTWNGRYHLKLTIAATTDLRGWEVMLMFSKPVTIVDFGSGDEVSRNADNTVVGVVGKPEHGTIHAGQSKTFDLYVNYASSTAPTVTTELVDLGSDNHTPEPVSPANEGEKYDYNRVLELSILFFEAQRSGKLPSDNRIPWRGDSALKDGSDVGVDLTGGWYDAGDHIKFNFPMAYSVTSLAWGLLMFKDAYQDAGQLDLIYDSIKWPLDYLVKCHVAPDVLYGQVGNGGLDHSFWGRPENMTMDRPSYKIDPAHPGSDLACEVAAAFSASSLAFKSVDPAYSATLLSHAKQLFQFAVDHPGKYSDSITDAKTYYSSFEYIDEYCWAGAWLYMATQDEQYLKEAEDHYEGGAAWGQSWDEKNSGCMVLLWKLTGNTTYKADIEATFNDVWLPGGELPYTPGGLAFRLQWGSNRYAANMALVALAAAQEGIMSDTLRKWAESQVNFMLGDGGRSYVVGFGNNFPLQPHHRSSSCPWYPAPCGSPVMSSNEPNVHTLYGALVGGPGQNGEYKDSRSDYQHNEVACDYNAGFQSAVAGLKHAYMNGNLPK